MMKIQGKIVLTALATALAALSARAGIEFRPVFQNNMVLQRAIAGYINSTWVSGTGGTPGATVTATIGGKSGTGVVAADGSWRAEIAGLAANTTGQTLSATDGSTTISIGNVRIGDVYLVNGHSMIGPGLGGGATRFATEFASVKPNVTSYAGGKWIAHATADSCSTGLGGLSSYFALELARALGNTVPVGIVRAAQSSATCGTYNPGQKNFESEIRPHTYTRICGVMLENWDRTKGAGTTLKSHIVSVRQQWGYDIWYGQNQTPGYRMTFPDFPEGGSCKMASEWHNIGSQGGTYEDDRAGELVNQKGAVANYLVAVVHDGGSMAEGSDVHSADRWLPAKQIARQFATKIHGKSLGDVAPAIWQSVTREGDKLRVSFDTVGGGLTTGYHLYSEIGKSAAATTDAVHGFAVAGSDKRYFWADAKIDGATVVASSPNVPEPVYLRYGDWFGPCDGSANLYYKVRNAAGTATGELLPVAPIRSGAATVTSTAGNFYSTRQSASGMWTVSGTAGSCGQLTIADGATLTGSSAAASKYTATNVKADGSFTVRNATLVVNQRCPEFGKASGTVTVDGGAITCVTPKHASSLKIYNLTGDNGKTGLPYDPWMSRFQARYNAASQNFVFTNGGSLPDTCFFAGNCDKVSVTVKNGTSTFGGLMIASSDASHAHTLTVENATLRAGHLSVAGYYWTHGKGAITLRGSGRIEAKNIWLAIGNGKYPTTPSEGNEKLIIAVPAAGWTASAPAVAASENLFIGDHVDLELDLAAFQPTGTSGTVTDYPVMTSANAIQFGSTVWPDGSKGKQPFLSRAQLLNVPDGCTAAVVASADGKSVLLRVTSTKTDSGKILVSSPTVAPKAYTGKTLTADVVATAQYAVTQNAGGTDVGTYDVVLTLTDTSKYAWSDDANSATKTLKFAITKATNGWTTKPSLSKTTWTLGACDATVNLGAAQFGTVQASCRTTADLAALGVGTHDVVFSVAETANYGALSETVVVRVIEKSDREDGRQSDVTASSYTWKGGDGAWNDDAKWTASASALCGIPDHSEYATAVFGAAVSSPATVTVGGKYVVSALTVSGGKEVTLAGSGTGASQVTVNGGLLTVAAPLTLKDLTLDCAAKGLKISSTLALKGAATVKGAVSFGTKPTLAVTLGASASKTTAPFVFTGSLALPDDLVLDVDASALSQASAVGSWPLCSASMLTGNAYQIFANSDFARVPAECRPSFRLEGNVLWLDITENRMYQTAQFKAVFKDWDGTVLYAQQIEENATPTKPADPTRAGYTFTGWSPSDLACRADTVFTAQYEKEGGEPEIGDTLAVPADDLTLSGGTYQCQNMTFAGTAANPAVLTLAGRAQLSFGKASSIQDSIVPNNGSKPGAIVVTGGSSLSSLTDRRFFYGTSDPQYVSFEVSGAGSKVDINQFGFGQYAPKTLVVKDSGTMMIHNHCLFSAVADSTLTVANGSFIANGGSNGTLGGSAARPRYAVSGANGKISAKVLEFNASGLTLAFGVPAGNWTAAPIAAESTGVIADGATVEIDVSALGLADGASASVPLVTAEGGLTVAPAMLTLVVPSGYTGTLSADAKTLSATVTKGGGGPTVEPAENSWTTEPSVSKTAWTEGETAGTLDFGKAKSGGAVTCNYTQDQVNAFAKGTYTVTFTVAATAEWTGLEKSISITVNEKQIDPEPPEHEEHIPTAFPGNSIVCIGDSLTSWGDDYVKGVPPSTAPDNYMPTILKGYGKNIQKDYPFYLAGRVGSSFTVLNMSKAGGVTDSIMSWFGEKSLVTVSNLAFSAGQATIAFSDLDAKGNHNLSVGNPTEVVKYRCYNRKGGEFPDLTMTDRVDEDLGGDASVAVNKLLGEMHGFGRVLLGEHSVTRLGDCSQPLTIPVGTRFTPDSAYMFRNSVHVIFTGTNDQSTRLKDVADVIKDYVDTLPNARYIVITSHYALNLSQHPEPYYQELFGEHYIALYDELSTNGVKRAIKLGLVDPSTADDQWISVLTKGASNPHFKDVGCKVLADVVHEKLQALGYLEKTEPVTPAENGWTAEPSVSKTVWTEGETAGTLSFGKAKSGGTVTCNYTQAQLDALAKGTYTVTFTVAATAEWTGLEKSIEVTVNEKQVTPDPPTPGDLPSCDDNWNLVVKDQKVAYDLDGGSCGESKSATEVGTPAWNATAAAAMSVNGHTLWLEGAEVTLTDGTYRFNQLELANNSSGTPSTLVVGNGATLALGGKKCSLGDPNYMWGNASWGWTLKVEQGGTLNLLGSYNNSAGTFNVNNGYAKNGTFIVDGGTVGGTAGGKLQRVGYMGGGFKSLQVLNGGRVAFATYSLDASYNVTGSSVTALDGTLASDTFEIKQKNCTVRVGGANGKISGGAFTVSGSGATLAFAVPAGNWSAAPFAFTGAASIADGTMLAVDPSGLALAAGASATIPLVTAGTLTANAANLTVAAVDGYTFTLAANGTGLSVVVKKSGDTPEPPVVEPAENSWATEPSVSPTSWTEGETAGTLDFGAAEYGEVTCNYTQDALNKLTKGTYTVTFTVAATDAYTGLEKSIEVTVVEKKVSLNAAEWTAYMQGVDTPEELAAVKAAVAGKPKVKIAFANSVTDRSHGTPHDDFEQNEMYSQAQYFGLDIEIVRVQPADPSSGRTMDVVYQEAVDSADIVCDFSSYWDDEEGKAHDGNARELAAQVIAANPNKLFILPYGEISSCPPTGTSLQSMALKRDGTGFKNLITTSPIAPSTGGNLTYVARRTAGDTETITFTIPSGWAAGTGDTCRSASVAGVLTAWIWAARGDSPNAATIAKMLSDASALPEVSELAGFTAEHLATLKSNLAAYTATDALGRSKLIYDKPINMANLLPLLPGPVTPAENSWSTEPSVSPTSWTEGETAGTLNFGAAKSGGTVTCNYTQDALNALTKGTYTVTFSVAATDAWTGLKKEISVTVNEKQVTPDPPTPGDLPSCDDNWNLIVKDQKVAYDLDGGSCGESKGFAEVGSPAWNASAAAAMGVNGHTLWLEGAEVTLTDGTYRFNQLELANNSSGTPSTLVVGNGATLALGGKKCSVGDPNYMWGNASWGWTLKVVQGGTLNLLGSHNNSAGTFNINNGCAKNGTFIVDGGTVGGSAGGKLQRVGYMGGGFRSLQVLNGGRVAFTTYSLDASYNVTGSSVTALDGTLAIDTFEIKQKNCTVRVGGANGKISGGAFTVSGSGATLAFAVPAGNWSAAPLAFTDAASIADGTTIAVDPSGLALAAGASATIPLVTAGTLTANAANLAVAAVDGYTFTLAANGTALSVVVKKSGDTPVIDPGAGVISVEITAETEELARKQVAIIPPAGAEVSKTDYAGYFELISEKIGEKTWRFEAVLKADVVRPELAETEDAPAFEIGAEDCVIRIGNVKPGLYYGYVTADSLRDLATAKPVMQAEPAKTSAALTLTLTKPSDQAGFYRIVVGASPGSK